MIVCQLYYVPASTQVNGNIGALREELKTSIDRHKAHTGISM